jgi:uncharacterized protein (DUF608 family)
MPLGGLGTGNLAICGDGSLRQWQLRNLSNHVGYIPFGFFAARWSGRNVRSQSVVLQSREFWDEPHFRPAPSVSDHVVPEEMKRTLGGLPMVPTTHILAAYPTMEIEYEMEGPLELRLTAWSPCVRGDADASGWPVAVFDFDVVNRADNPIEFSLLSSFQNAVGWDGVNNIHGVENCGYGGNRNRRVADLLVMENVILPDDHPSQGQLVLAGEGGAKQYSPQWSDLGALWDSFKRGNIAPSSECQPSSPGRTWNAALSQRVEVQPGETKRITFVFAWHFPNRYVDWAQWDDLIPAAKSRFYLGNHYSFRSEPMLWMNGFLSQVGDLRTKTLDYWADVHSDLPEPISRAVGSSVANLRTNVCLWTEDGRFYGFEGGHGASTWMPSGGCCPMSCTHVWNYEQGLVELWPDLFRSMRESDWMINQSPDGQLPHRITLPVYVRKLWDHPIGGPEKPAIDGLCAGVLKTYQYYLRSEDAEWMKKIWPNVRKAMEWMMTRDDRGDGVIDGEQPNTYDIHVYGPNTFIGSQYLAALLAAERMAEVVGEDPIPYRSRFETGSPAYDELCFNGEYYIQRIPEGCEEPYQFGEGCVADQLLGQWWAHHLDLGYVLPQEHVQSAVAAIFRRNFRSHFVGFKQEPRVFASEDDRGLLVATYEPGQRPKVPLLYSDEVWTGIEYAFAALCFYEGLVDEGMEVVSGARDRYDGRERNPFNEVECGDHYIRALSAWSLPKAWRSSLNR